MTASTCCRCAGGVSAGGVFYAGDDTNQAGRYCLSCIDVVAFWEVIDGDAATPCEVCGVQVFDRDACYDMAAVFCPPCWLRTFDGDPVSQ